MQSITIKGSEIVGSIGLGCVIYGATAGMYHSMKKILYIILPQQDDQENSSFSLSLTGLVLILISVKTR